MTSRSRSKVPSFAALAEADLADRATYAVDHSHVSAFAFTKLVHTGRMADRHLFYPVLGSRHLHHTKRRPDLTRTAPGNATFYSAHFQGGTYAHVSVYRDSWDASREFHVTVYHFDASDLYHADCSVFFEFPATRVAGRTRKAVCPDRLSDVVEAMRLLFVDMVRNVAAGTLVRTTAVTSPNVRQFSAVAPRVTKTPMNKGSRSASAPGPTSKRRLFTR